MRTLTFIPALLTRLGLLSALSLTAFSAQAQTAPTWASVRRIDGGSAPSINLGLDVAIAPDGSQLVLGIFEGVVVLGNTTLAASVNQQLSYYLAKYNPDGSVAWARLVEEQGSTSESHLSVDGSGNVYLAGYFAEAISFNPATGPAVVLTAASDAVDAYVAKFSPQGTLLWSKKGDVSNGDAYVGGVATDAQGNVYVAGDFDGSLSFGAGAGQQLSAVDNSIFLYKFAADGTPVWARRSGGNGLAYNYGVAADATGNAYLTGEFGGDVTFGTNTIATAVDYDIFAVKYDPQGTPLWAQRTGTANDDGGRSIAVDAAGSVVVGGFARNAAGDESEAFLARFGPQGAPLWTRRVTPSIAGENIFDDVTFDGRGGIYAISGFDGTVTLGGTTLTTPRETSFVARYNYAGNAVWAAAPTLDNSFSQAFLFDVAADAAGNAYLAGVVEDNVTFGTVNSSGTGINSVFVRLNAGGVISSARSRAAEAPLAAYPNPASERTSLMLPAGGGQLLVSDALGRTVRQQALPTAAGPCEVPLAGLTPGIYQLRATLANGQTATTRLTVR